MSVIVAVYDDKNDRYILGADTQVTTGDFKSSMSSNESKIFEYEVGGDFPKIVMGGTGNLRAVQVIKYSTLFCADDFLENKDGFDGRWVCNELVPRLFGALAQVGLVADKHDENSRISCKIIPCQLMFACGNKCFTIYQDGCISEVEDFDVIGLGRDLSYGALSRSASTNPFKRVKEGVEAAGEHTIYVNKEVDFFTTDDIKGEEEFLTKEDYEGLEKFWEETKIRQQANYLDLIHYREFKQLVKSKVSDELWEEIQTEFAKIIAGDEEDGVSSSND